MALAAVFQEQHSCTDAKKALNILTSPSFVLLSPSLPLVLLPLLLMKMCWRALNSKKVQQEEEEENTLNINELKFFKKKQRRN